MGRILSAILAVVIVGAALVYATFARDLTAARARLVGRSSTIQTSFGTLEYALLGEGEPVLIVHGAEGGFDQGLDMTGVKRGQRITVTALRAGQGPGRA
jgi:hypothetical protein